MTDSPGGPDIDVIVVGLGPVGAVLAGLLAADGWQVRAFERAEQPYALPRAAHIDHEVMRILQRVGVADRIGASIRIASPYEFRAADGRVLVRFEADPTGSPSGWPASHLIHQPGIESVLRAHLATLPTLDIRPGCEVIETRSDRQGVAAVWRHGSEVGEARARFLVACDGASSAVRERLGIALDDFAFDEPWLVIDAHVADWPHRPSVNLQMCDPARPTTSVLMPGGRHRWEFMLRPGEDAVAALDQSFIRDLLEPWQVPPDLTIDRKAVYRFHGLIARQWRQGRILLAGDAAHQMPPFAGQGLCSGVRDAANLAWKLGAVLSGAANADLLDTYQTERAPHVRQYVDLAIEMGKIVCMLDPEQAAARDAKMSAAWAAGRSPLPPYPTPSLGPGCFLNRAPAGAYFPQFWAGSGDGFSRLDDSLGRHAWLIDRTGPPDVGPFPGLAAFGLDDAPLSPFRSALAGWLEHHCVDAVLVRADRYVFGGGSAADLLAAFRAVLSLPGQHSSAA